MASAMTMKKKKYSNESIIKLEGQLFRTGRRTTPKFLTHVRI